MVPKPKLKPRIKEAPPLDVLYLTTYEIQQVLSKRNAWNGHWLHGLSSTGSHRWRILRTEIWYGAEESAAIANGTSESSFRLRGGGKDLWRLLSKGCAGQ